MVKVLLDERGRIVTIVQEEMVPVILEIHDYEKLTPVDLSEVCDKDKPLTDRIEQVLYKLRTCSIEDISVYSGAIHVSLSWGDWKHEHSFLDHIMKETFGLDLFEEDVTESNGSDCYSAVHHYLLPQEEVAS